MKITKAKLKEIIKEELSVDEYKPTINKQLSQMIDKLDQAINTIEGAAGSVGGEVAQTLDMGIKQAEAVWEELHSLLDSQRG